MLMMIIYNPKYSWCTCMYMYILHVTNIYYSIYIYILYIYIYIYIHTVYICVCVSYVRTYITIVSCQFGECQLGQRSPCWRSELRNLRPSFPTTIHRLTSSGTLGAMLRCYMAGGCGGLIRARIRCGLVGHVVPQLALWPIVFLRGLNQQYGYTMIYPPVKHSNLENPPKWRFVQCGPPSYKLVYKPH